MADTERTLTDLLTNLFQDGQSDNSITANDIRDLIVSLAPAYGSMYVSSAAETTISGVDTPTKAAGTTTAGVKLRDFTHANNRLTYTGVPTRAFIISLSATITSASSNQSLAFHIAKTGSVAVASLQRRKIATGSDEGSVSVMVELELATNDYVEFFVENKTGSGNITVELMNLEVRSLIE